ncbi:MAG: hypothetical protein ACTHJT_17490 [Cytophaga sp.]|uniref:hypothetical protein n=1 Tax=Cytophaga sp. TaxID=29535 RepID=UPI003F805AC9
MGITIESLRALAKQNLLNKELKYDDSFVVSEEHKAEVESLLREGKVGYQGITQPANNVLFIIQPYGEQG